MDRVTYRLRITCAMDRFVPDGSHFHTGTWEQVGEGHDTLYVRGKDWRDREDEDGEGR